MAQFYGRLRGNRGEATRCGSKDSGITVTAESWTTVIRTMQFHSEGRDKARIAVETKYGNHLLDVEFDAEGLRLHAGSDSDVDMALLGIEKAFFTLNSAIQKADDEAREIEREERTAA